jgi:hypothetical protein
MAGPLKCRDPGWSLFLDALPPSLSLSNTIVSCAGEHSDHELFQSSLSPLTSS